MYHFGEFKKRNKNIVPYDIGYIITITKLAKYEPNRRTLKNQLEKPNVRLRYLVLKISSFTLGFMA